MEKTRSLRDRIEDLLRSGFEAAIEAEALPEFDIPASIPVAPSRHEAHGDYGSPVCLGLAKVLRRAPIQIAEAVAPYVPEADFVGAVEVAPPGYVNVTLDEGWLAEQVPVILEAGETWGALDHGAGERVQVEFVSANPTGPLTIGSARNAVLGDALATVLDAAGYDVAREYYVNDAGSKARKLGYSIYVRYRELLDEPVEIEEEMYPGDYVTEMARQLIEQVGERFVDTDAEEVTGKVTDWGVEQVLAGVETDLAQMRIHFDSWRHERDFYRGDPSLYEQMLERLRADGYVIEKEGATWFTHPDLENDAVLIRSADVIPNPEDRPTYLMSDVCYAWDKLEFHGFDRALYIWGADHHGDVSRVKAVVKALGLDPERAELILYQLVTMRRGEEVLRMSKSSGEFVTLRELIDEVGPDPIRYMLLTRTADVTMDFDLALAVEQSDRNPVYYVQYAHTRIAGVLRHAVEQGWDPETMGDPALLTHDSELALIRKMMELPEIIELAANNLAPHHLTTYAHELASLFHAFYHHCRIVSSEPGDEAITRTRLMLARATKSVLARVLHLMGMGAPETM